jgi:predicted peroxiredoxin
VIYAGQNEPGRVFHALIHAKQAHSRGDDTQVYFAAEGTYWPGVLTENSHSMHALYKEVSQAGVIKGACENCANAFGHADSAGAACGLVRGSKESFGQIDILGLEDAGWRVWQF